MSASKDLESILKRSFLNLEIIDNNIYRSTSLWRPSLLSHETGVYGGQLVGQALAAASKTIPDTQHAHSLHCYYINKGSSNKPILYHIEKTRDGNTYSSRNVKAIQNGQPLLTMQTSFKCEETDEFCHQFTMPIVEKQPEETLNVEELYQLAVQNGYGTEKERRMLQSLTDHEFPFDVRPLHPYDLLERGSQIEEPKRKYWIKANGHLGEDSIIHQCAAAFLTDYLFVDVATLCSTDISLQVVSLDHSVWFHNTFHANDWLLYEMESPQRGNGTALATGRLWTRDGVLAMSVAQEGIIRKFSKL
ncbi:acyl-coenzyme A thioesterase 8 [Patella vulgata]|uniref:acyl-coenzyme A thioesterase 8 n=1 Tax=Patella vulgata TaxID=6465 RepID=UPI0024A7D824|nr:acyl-coenzyme A thioesterase 8 [Patella vulgata]